MSVQRFEIAEDENAGGEPCMFPADEGEWMRYVDHCHKVFSLKFSLAEREQRIASLTEALQFSEAALDAAREVYQIQGNRKGVELMDVALSKARAALATEGEKRE